MVDESSFNLSDFVEMVSGLNIGDQRKVKRTLLLY
jgi:hypothetical protein